MGRAGKIFAFMTWLLVPVFGCGTPETDEEKANRAREEMSFSADVAATQQQLPDGELLAKSPSFQLTEDGKTPWLYLDVATYPESGPKTRCLTSIPDDLPVAKVFCEGSTKAQATLTAGQLPKVCVITGEEQPQVTDFNFDCAAIRIVRLGTNPPLFMGLR